MIVRLQSRAPLQRWARALICAWSAAALGGLGAEEIEGALDLSDTPVDAGFLSDTHRVPLRVGQVAVITASAADLDPRLVVHHGARVFADDNSGGERAARVVFRARVSAEAEVAVTSFAPGMMGDYRLHTEIIEPVPISMGDERSGSCRQGPVVHRLSVRAGQPLLIGATSADIDLTLLVTGPDDAPRFDDDGGEGLNPRLLWIPRRSGEALLTVAPFLGGGGEFTLSVLPLEPLTSIALDEGLSSVTRGDLAAGAGPLTVGAVASPGHVLRATLRSEGIEPHLFAVARGHLLVTERSRDEDLATLSLRMPGHAEVFFLVGRPPEGTGHFTLEVIDEGFPRLPAFELHDLEGRRVSSSRFAGRVRIIDVWATWSGQARHQLPALEELAQRHSGGGLAAIGIAVDDDPAAVAREVARRQVTYPVLLDDGHTAADLGALTPDGRLMEYPTTLVVDRRGAVRRVFVGPRPEGAVAEAAERLLARP